MFAKNQFYSPPIECVRLQDPVFAPRLEMNRRVTIPSCLLRCKETGRLEAFRLNWKPGMENRPHIFWDSDVAKVLEGMAHTLLLKKDPEMEAELNSLVDLLLSSQQPDGYLNSYYTRMEPENRWKNLHAGHELYCAGHLIEAAVAHFHATGKRNFLDAMCRYADLIATVFGNAPGQRRGYPGHEELELALCSLARTTGNQKYLNLASYFVHERGRAPNYFATEESVPESALAELQAHRPVMEQSDAVGHAVRAVYLYCGMADVASETNDKKLFAACERLFDSMVSRRMYVTGGIGSSGNGECFEGDYKLPNESAYAESCAAIGLVLFASRMYQLSGETKYMDVLERVLYNGALSGIGLEGDRFFYQNMLEVHEHSSFPPVRRKWFDCSCCPTNYCRFLPQIGSFVWSENANEVRLNLPVASVYHSGERKIVVSSAYPYDGSVRIEFESDGDFIFSIRIPDWCKKYTAKLNGKTVTRSAKKGLLSFPGRRQRFDVLEIRLMMPVRVMRSHPRVRANAGKIVLTRGPLVYALESIDNGVPLSRLSIPSGQRFQIGKAKGLPRGTATIHGKALAQIMPETESLYFECVPKSKKVNFVAIPYALWQNRGPTEMTVWIREADCK